MTLPEEVLDKVRSALASEPGFNATTSPIALAFSYETLTLEGEVANVAVKKLLLERAAAVPEVTGILDRLHVKPAQPMGDGEIRNLVRDALLQEPVFGQCTLRQRLKGQEELVRQPADEPRGDLCLSVDGGVVTLDGEVPSLSHKRLAGVLAWWVPGSRDVFNGLEVAPPEADNDDEIRDALRLVLEKDPFVNAGQVMVSSQNYVVTLDGLVPTESEREMAAFDAWYLFGVDKVVNNIRVQIWPARPSMMHDAAYLALQDSGELTIRTEEARDHLYDCDLCARYCHADRVASLRGVVCRTGEQARIHSFGPHHGEEHCLRGWNGSGTIFFSWCNLRCIFCQNWEISWKGEGREVPAEELADMMLRLQTMGCHNINLVSPSHVVAQVIAAVAIAAGEGLRLPLVYNTGGYDSLEALRLLDGIVDIYMPDMKYGDAELAHRYSHVRDYVRFNQAAVREMHRQVGDLTIGTDGLAQRGLLVRHLVLPDGIAGTEAVARFLAEQISADTYLNVMAQYRPCYRADEFPDLDRGITAHELQEALAAVHRHGLRRLDQPVRQYC